MAGHTAAVDVRCVYLTNCCGPRQLRSSSRLRRGSRPMLRFSKECIGNRLVWKPPRFQKNQFRRRLQTSTNSVPDKTGDDVLDLTPGKFCCLCHVQALMGCCSLAFTSAESNLAVARCGVFCKLRLSGEWGAAPEIGACWVCCCV